MILCNETYFFFRGPSILCVGSILIMGPIIVNQLEFGITIASCQKIHTIMHLHLDYSDSITVYNESGKIIHFLIKVPLEVYNDFFQNIDPYGKEYSIRLEFPHFITEKKRRPFRF